MPQQRLRISVNNVIILICLLCQIQFSMGGSNDPCATTNLLIVDATICNCAAGGDGTGAIGKICKNNTDLIANCSVNTGYKIITTECACGPDGGTGTGALVENAVCNVSGSAGLRLDDCGVIEGEKKLITNIASKTNSKCGCSGTTSGVEITQNGKWCLVDSQAGTQKDNCTAGDVAASACICKGASNTIGLDVTADQGCFSDGKVILACGSDKQATATEGCVCGSTSKVIVQKDNFCKDNSGSGKSYITCTSGDSVQTEKCKCGSNYCEKYSLCQSGTCEDASRKYGTTVCNSSVTTCSGCNETTCLSPQKNSANQCQKNTSTTLGHICGVSGNYESTVCTSLQTTCSTCSEQTCLLPQTDGSNQCEKGSTSLKCQDVESSSSTTGLIIVDLAVLFQIIAL